MSSFNEKAYVGMMYSFEELMRHLVEVGPVAASVVAIWVFIKQAVI